MFCVRAGMDEDTWRILVSMQDREISPNDYAILSALDAQIKPAGLPAAEVNRFPTAVVIHDEATTAAVTAANAADAADTGSAVAVRDASGCIHSITSAGDCNICYCEFEIGERVRKLTCGHVFHQDCIDRWLQEATTCPVDRQELFAPPPGACIDFDFDALPRATLPSAPAPAPAPAPAAPTEVTNTAPPPEGVIESGGKSGGGGESENESERESGGTRPSIHFGVPSGTAAAATTCNTTTATTNTTPPTTAATAAATTTLSPTPTNTTPPTAAATAATPPTLSPTPTNTAAFRSAARDHGTEDATTAAEHAVAFIGVNTVDATPLQYPRLAPLLPGQRVPLHASLYTPQRSLQRTVPLLAITPASASASASAAQITIKSKPRGTALKSKKHCGGSVGAHRRHRSQVPVPFIVPRSRLVAIAT